jgi:hypothetical protein
MWAAERMERVAEKMERVVVMLEKVVVWVVRVVEMMLRGSRTILAREGCCLDNGAASGTIALHIRC